MRRTDGNVAATRDSLDSLEKIHSGVVADMLALASEVNSRLETLESAESPDSQALETRLNLLEGRHVKRVRRLEEFVSRLDQLQEERGQRNDAVWAEYERRLQELQRYLVATAQAPVPAVMNSNLPVAPQQVIPQAVSAAGLEMASLERLAAMQRQAQQAFAERRPQGLAQPGGDGVGL